jgi:hypothetical protein
VNWPLSCDVRSSCRTRGPERGKEKSAREKVAGFSGTCLQRLKCNLVTCFVESSDIAKDLCPIVFFHVIPKFCQSNVSTVVYHAFLPSSSHHLEHIQSHSSFLENRPNFADDPSIIQYNFNQPHGAATMLYELLDHQSLVRFKKKIHPICYPSLLCIEGCHHL